MQMNEIKSAPTERDEGSFMEKFRIPPRNLYVTIKDKLS
jgi:hypothetical protein